jgi:hypothetical protein
MVMKKKPAPPALTKSAATRIRTKAKQIMGLPKGDKDSAAGAAN